MTDHLTQSAVPEAGTMPPAAIPQPDGSLSCPHCGAEVAAQEAFCEACGGALTPSATGPAEEPDEMAAPIDLTRSVQTKAEDQDAVVAARPCAQLRRRHWGRRLLRDLRHQGADGTRPLHRASGPVGRRLLRPRRTTSPQRRRDGVAAEQDAGSRAVLVVCDGVSTSLDSDVASLAAARTARDALAAHKPAGLGTPASRVAAISNAVVKAAAAANAAVIENTAPGSDNAASCTFAAAVVEDDLVVYGNVGDSRIYWIPDRGSSEDPTELSVDDSVAQMRIAMGTPRDEAENGPQAHAITKWLGRDSPDFAPRTGSLTVVAPGWLLVCSDGLWNYASEASAIQSLIADLTSEDPSRLRWRSLS